jgi:hypothetical protein
MEKHKLDDIEPLKMTPTWRNGRSGEDVVAKRLDRFLVSEDLLETRVHVRASVTEGGLSGSSPYSFADMF